MPFAVHKPAGKQDIAPGLAVASRPALPPSPPSMSIREQHGNTDKPSGIWETGSFSFRDILDAINPLQHIPIISTIYRKLTGDHMGYASRIVGDTLFGGVFGSFISGAISAIANVFLDAFTGQDIGEHVMAAVKPAAPPASSPAIYARNIPVNPLSSHGQSRQETILADLTSNQPGAVPLNGVSRAQAAIEQYKWQIIAGEVKHRSGYWG